ncbi:PAS domain S-box protein [bacterium]|nr:PAS domain S-box protein [bacterium]
MENKRSETTQDPVENGYRRILDLAPSWEYLRRRDGSFIYVSPGCEQITGHLVAEFIDDPALYLRIVHPDDRARVADHLAGQVSREEVQHLEYRIIRRDGQERWISHLCRHLYTGERDVLQCRGSNRDITDLKNQRELVRAKEKHYRSFFHDNLDAVFSVDAIGRFTEVNPVAESLFGFFAEELLGMSFMQICAPDQLESTARHFRNSLTGEFRDLETAVIRRDGRRVDLYLTGSPIRSNGRISGLFVVAKDISSLRQTENDLRRDKDEIEARVRSRTAELQERAQQLARLASELTLAEQRERRRLAQVLHDHLQQLLVGAKLGLQVLGKRTRGDQQKEAIQQIAGLLEEAIRSSRSLTVELSPPVLHEAGLVAGLEWLSCWTEEKHGLPVRIEGEEGLSAGREDLNILLFESVRELLFNAVKHAHATCVVVCLDRVSDIFVRIQVIDDGVGFDPANLRSRGGGFTVGFGLLSIQERLNLLGGRLEIESAPGKGSTFSVIAPIQPRTAPETS